MTTAGTDQPVANAPFEPGRREFLLAVGGAALAIGGCASPPAAAPPLGSISEASATALARAIRTKQISALEAVDQLLQRIETVNPKLNAVVQLRADAARADARAADQALA